MATKRLLAARFISRQGMYLNSDVTGFQNELTNCILLVTHYRLLTHYESTLFLHCDRLF